MQSVVGVRHQLVFLVAFPLAACAKSDGKTGPATLSRNGGAAITVSAWATKPNPDVFLLTQTGNAYLPWEITIGSVPAGTDCASGTGHGSLQHDASSWLASIEVAVPYASGDDKRALSILPEGDMPVQELSSGSMVIAPVAGVQIFTDESSDLGDMSGGTLTIESFSDAAIEGRFEVTGSGVTTTASSAFTANRCDF